MNLQRVGMMRACANFNLNKSCFGTKQYIHGNFSNFTRWSSQETTGQFSGYNLFSALDAHSKTAKVISPTKLFMCLNSSPSALLEGVAIIWGWPVNKGSVWSWLQKYIAPRLPLLQWLLPNHSHFDFCCVLCAHSAPWNSHGPHV